MLKALDPLFIKVGWCVLCLYLMTSPYRASCQKTDSLETLLSQELPDTQRMDILIDLTDILQFQNPQQGITYGQEVVLMARDRRDTARWTDVLSRIGACYANLGEINRTEELWRETLALEIARNDSMGIGRQYTNIGTALDTRGDLDSAIVVQIVRSEQGLQVRVRDNGQGLPTDFQPEQSNSLGFKLIRSFAQKMKAKLDVLSQGGTQVSLLLPNV